MKKNSDFKNISYVNYEMISMFLALMSCAFISYSPIRIIEKCGSASVIGILFICLIAFFIYFFITKETFKNEYDIFEVIKKTYPPFFQKLVAIIIYIFTLLYTYLLISNLLYNLKASIYTNSTMFAISIFFIVALYILTKKGFNTIFRIVGYISYIIVIYILFLLGMSIFKLNIYNYVPVLGDGFSNVFGSNLLNIGVFAPLLLFLFFGGRVVNNKKRSNIKNFNIIMIIFTLLYTLLIFMFIGTVPIEIISSRYTLLLDLSSFISLTPLSLKLTPLMIFVFSFLIFVSSSFTLLCGLYNTERLQLIKDYSKYILPSIIILTILFYIPIPLSLYNTILDIFYFSSIVVTFIFPIATIIIYKIKNKGGTKKFKNLPNMEEVIEEVN